MGITISYRGSIADLDRIVDFEDRVLDLALELGGQATVWRTANDNNPTRMVRGIMLDLYPGQETTSLLVSPEGWLVNLFEIEDAELGKIDKPSWCFVKTQFGPVEGHVALVELLTVLKREFFPDLEVRDEGGYWEARDLAALTAKFEFLQSAVDGMAAGLQRFGLSGEAAEDREILLARIERIAKLVHRTLSRPAEHPLVHWDEEDDEPLGFEADVDDDELKWDDLFRENRRRQEHIHRAIEEHLAQGDDTKEAFDAAMNEETAFGLPEDSPESTPFGTWKGEFEAEEAEENEPWRKSLDELPENNGPLEDEDEPFGKPRHPLQQLAWDLMLRLYKLLENTATSAESHRGVLLHGAGEISGGLAQALGGDDDWEPPAGLAMVQLKRALRGAAFASGALYPLRTDGTLDQASFQELHDLLEKLQEGIYAELLRLRGRRDEEI